MLNVRICMGITMAFIALHPYSVSGQNAEKEYTLDEIVGLALERSELIAGGRYTVKESSEYRKQATALPNPSIGLSSGYVSADGKRGAAYGVTLTQPFVFPGKRRSIDGIMAMDEKLSELDLREAVLTVRYGVIRAGYSYMVYGELLSHLEERMRRFRVMEGYMNSRPFAASRARMDKYIVSGRILLLQKELDRLKADRDRYRIQLGTYLDLPENLRISAPLFVRGPEITEEEIAESAAEKNPSVRRLDAALEKSKLRRRHATLGRYPDFDLTAYYNADPSVSGETQAGIGMTLKLPILDRNAGEIGGTEYGAMAAGEKLAFQKRETKQHVAAAFREYRLAAKNLVRFPESLLDRAHGQLADADREFAKGTIDLITYLEVESQAHETHLAFFESQMEFMSAYTGLLFLAGRDDFKTGE